jgi:hypothetical protein
MIRLWLGLALALFVVLPFGIATVEAVRDARRPVLSVDDLSRFDARTVPHGGWVKTTLRNEHVRVLGSYASGGGMVVSVDGANAVVSLDKSEYETLRRDGRFDVLGYVTKAHPQNTPGVTKEMPQIVQNPGGHVAWTVPAALAAIMAVAGLASAFLLNTWRKRRPASDHDRATTTERAGWFERWGQSYPGAVEAFGSVSFNGFGLRWIDFHDPGEDGAALATQWFTFAFFPAGPVRRARIRVLAERDRGVPGVMQVGTMHYVLLQQLPVDGTRNGRVYAFYFGVILPMMLVPTLAGFATMVALDFTFAAWTFWVGLLAVMLVGGGAVFIERRVMGPPSGQ